MSNMSFLLLQVFIWFGADATDIEKKLSVKATQVCLSLDLPLASTSKEREGGEELSAVYYLLLRCT